MPAATKHIDQAGRNIQLLSIFFPQHTHNDWAVTLSFYSVVHIVEAAVYLKQNIKFMGTDLAVKDVSDIPFQLEKLNVSGSLKHAVSKQSLHEMRDVVVQDNFPEIADEYHTLRIQSGDARYKCWKVEGYVADYAVKTSLVKCVDWFNKEFKQTIAIPASLKN